MDWKECLREEVSVVSPNEEIARSLLQMCRARLEIAKGMPRKYPALIAEVYYEIMKEQITALLALHGFKSYSHKCLVSFLGEFYADEISSAELALIDRLRIIRNDVGYRGVFNGGDFLERNEKRAISLIEKLFEIVEEKLKNQ